MVKTKLVDALILDGEKILRELDHQKFPVESMFWIEVPEQGLECALPLRQRNQGQVTVR